MKTSDTKADTLIHKLKDAGYQAFAYSGRGMYGKQCVAIRIPEGNYFNGPIPFKDHRLDQMGKGHVMYWPDVPAPDDLD